MDHKDLLNEVIAGMTEDKTTEIPNDVDDTAIDNAIRLPLSTGEIFLVDVNAFDWENAVSNLPHIMDNEVSFVRMATTLIQIKGDEYKNYIYIIIQSTKIKNTRYLNQSSVFFD